MSVNKLGIILFSSFLVFAMAPIAPAQSTQNQTQDQTKKQTEKKGNRKTETEKTTEKRTETQQKTQTDQNAQTEKKAPSEKKTGTTGKTGAKKAKKTGALSQDKVRQVQMALKNDGFDPGPIDGIMGPMTMTALRNYQSHNKLQVTGTLTAETENMLLQGASAGATRRRSMPPRSRNEPGDSTRESSGQSSEPAVSSVEDVKKIQQELTDLQYDPGEVNGMMTAQTQQAIREFQYLNNLSVTGTVDEQTKVALDTRWQGGAQTAQREKPGATRDYEQNQAPAPSSQNRTDTYSRDRTTTNDTTYSQDRTDRGTSSAQSRDTTTDHDRYNKGRDTKSHDRAAGKSDKDGASRVSKAAAVLQDLTASADKRIPNELLERAEAVAVIPHMIKGAFGIGGRYGKGVVSQRLDSGRWSAPAFIEIGGGSFGAQIGGSATDLVLIFTDRNALDLLMGGKDLKLGVDAGVTAGPIGREAEAGVNTTLSSAIYAYSRSRGLFAGVALDGAVLNMDKDMNRKVYGESADAKDILNGKVAMNSAVRPFVDALDKVVPKKRISQK